jgi:hypothetical protein
MDGITRAISLIHDLVVKFKIFQDHKMVLEPYNSIDTLSKTLSLTQLQSSSDMTHSNARALSGDDLFLDGWNESYVVQSSVWNNSDTQLF